MKTKTVYLFDESTGVFLGEIEANESPLEPDVFHTPIFSTDQQPPAVGVNECAVIDVVSKAWIIKPVLVTESNGVQESIIDPTYAQLRAAAYPPLADQLDMQFKDALNGTTTWVDAIAAVKAMYPKV